MASTPTTLEDLAAADPAVAPLARLLALALRTADDPGWADGLPRLDRPESGDAAPLLHGATIEVDLDRLRALAGDLAAVACPPAVERVRRLPDERLLALARASIVLDHGYFDAAGGDVDLEPGLLSIVMHAATLPLLLAHGRHAAETAPPRGWAHGYCPVCAAWPILAEVRGLERDLVLRCGRCAAAWRFEHFRCVFCGSRDHRAQSYFAPERERESRRAVTCDGCHGYLKTQATLMPLEPAALLRHDLQSLELDLAVVEHGYARPPRPGWSLELRLVPGRSRNGRH